jgi:hypothetical protein
VSATAFALLAGVSYLFFGLAGLVPAALVPPPLDAPPTWFALLYGDLFGLFPVNVLASAVHLAFGFWGLCAALHKCSAVAYARALAIAFGVLALLGLLPGTGTLFGAMPAYGADVWLHAATAFVAAYFGWRPSAVARERRRNPRDRRQRDVPIARERRFGLADRREGWSAVSLA